MCQPSSENAKLVKLYLLRPLWPNRGNGGADKTKRSGIGNIDIYFVTGEKQWNNERCQRKTRKGPCLQNHNYPYLNIHGVGPVPYLVCLTGGLLHDGV